VSPKATSHLQSSKQKELLQLILKVLGAYFPTGFGLLDHFGKSVKTAQRFRFNATVTQPNDIPVRPFVYDLYLFLSDEAEPFKRGETRPIGSRGTHIKLFTRNLQSSRPQELVKTGIHEMTHMLRSLFRAFEDKFGEAAVVDYPSRSVASLLNLKAFQGHRKKMERHFSNLVMSLEREGDVRGITNLSAIIADHLLEEVFSFVFGQYVGEAIAYMEAKTMAKRTRQPAIAINQGFQPEEFLKDYIRYHWLKEPSFQASLKTVSASKIIDNMSDDLRAIVTDMEKHLSS
jgi:hypothetical protein